MDRNKTESKFDATLLRPKGMPDERPWAFIVLPREASQKLPRRGRTSVEGTCNGMPFRAQLEPDGQKSHWLRITPELLEASGSCFGDVAQFDIRSPEVEPEPEVPADLQLALKSSPDALATWERTTTLARVDWIHWIVSAKQAKTRAKRIADACDMLGSGKRRVCCFDPSGFYSKALSAPEPSDS